jgi:hypothetical protein
MPRVVVTATFAKARLPEMVHSGARELDPPQARSPLHHLRRDPGREEHFSARQQPSVVEVRPELRVIDSGDVDLVGGRLLSGHDGDPARLSVDDEPRMEPSHALELFLRHAGGHEHVDRVTFLGHSGSAGSTGSRYDISSDNLACL